MSRSAADRVAAVRVPVPRGPEDATPDPDAISELVLDLVCVCGLDGRFRWVNAAWTTTLGYEARELTSRPFLDFVHPDDVEDTVAAVAALAAGQRIVRFRNRYRHRDGSYRHLEWNSQVPPGRRHIYAVARDITEGVRRVQGHEALQAAWLDLDRCATVEEALRVVEAQACALTDATHAAVALAAAPGGPVDHLDGHPHAAPGRASLLVPLVDHDGNAVGHLSVVREGGDVFDELAEELLVTFSRIASLTLERLTAERDVAATLARTERLLNSVTDAFLLLDEEWRFSHLNAEAERVLRRPAAELLGTCLWDAFPEAVGTPFQEHYEEAVATGRPTSFLAHYPPLDAWFDVRAYPADGGLAVYFLVADERIAAERELRRRVGQQESVAALGQEALVGADRESLLRRAADDVARLLPARRVEVLQVDRATGQLVAPGGAPGQDVDGRTTARTDVTTGSARAREALRRGAPVTASSEGPPGAAVPVGRPGAWWGVLDVELEDAALLSASDVLYLRQVATVVAAALERQDSEDRVQHQATHDALTSLPNRPHLSSVLDEALGGPATGRLALLLLDLDGFKDVNDSLGHAAGDAVLVQVADRIAEAAGGHLVARLGGDEFAVCVRGGADEAVAVADRLLAVVAEPFPLPQLDVSLSGSIGIALAPDDASDASSLLSHADVAMYRAKAEHAGWRRYDTALDAAQAERLALVADLRRAIADGDVRVHYQPVIDMASGQPAWYEALARWRHPERGVDVPPSVFIPLAEQTGLIGPLTALVVQTVLAEAPAFLEAGAPARCAINLSVHALRNPGCGAALLQQLVAGRHLLSVEVTESALADAAAQQAVRQLAEAGVRCAIDDFGTGYSSLAALKDLPASTVKIDRAFVQDVEHSTVDLQILRLVAELGRVLGLDVVAEGVETAEAADTLRDAGVSLAQGYLYARPMPLEALQAWLRERGRDGAALSGGAAGSPPARTPAAAPLR